MRTRLLLSAPVLLSLGGACDADFAPASAVTSVRVLATRAEPPYARPGEKVTLTTLAVDGRAERPTPLRVTYFPKPCVDPEDDDVARCYPELAASFPLHTDLTPQLSHGETFTLALPDDAVTAHAGARGGPPYGLVFVFVAACAGHLERVDERWQGSPPFGCFDGAGRQLGPEHFVFAFARVTASDALRNANPVIDAVLVDGAPIDESAGVTVPRCTESSEDDCPKLKLDVSVPAGSQEPDPVASTPESPSGESLWVDGYATAGKLEHDRIVLYDGVAGRTPDTQNTFTTPKTPGNFGLWTVVRDSRGGVAWRAIALHVK